MIYCGVDEAFDNSLNTQMNEYERANKNNNKSSNDNVIPPNTYDNYSDIDIQNHFNNNMNQYNKMVPAFFTTQGDYSTKGPYFGTSINDLKNSTPEDSDSLSLLDSNFSEDSNLSVQTPKKPNHSYCINKIVQGLIEDPDNISLASSQNDEAYKHVKTCKYCKNKINQRMKEHFNPNINQDSLTKLSCKKENIKEYFDAGNLGYDLKELLIIILAGIILIFILDLLVKIGKKMNK